MVPTNYDPLYPRIAIYLEVMTENEDITAFGRAQGGGRAEDGRALTGRAIGRCKNFFALGVVYWLFGRPMEPTLRWVEQKFGKPGMDIFQVVNMLRRLYGFY